MRFRHLSFPLALLLPLALVAVFADDRPNSTQIATAAGAGTAVERPDTGDPDGAWLVTQAERLRIELAEAEAVRVEAEQAQARAEAAAAAEAAEAAAAAEAAEAAEAAHQAQHAAEREAKAEKARQAQRRSTTATTAAGVAAEPTPRATGSLPPQYVSDCESGGNPQAVNPNGHYGKWQFSQSTWESVGGTGRPDQASEAEQDKRASILWANGEGAGHWSCY